jgi:hypothetical protein
VLAPGCPHSGLRTSLGSRKNYDTRAETSPGTVRHAGEVRPVFGPGVPRFPAIVAAGSPSRHSAWPQDVPGRYCDVPPDGNCAMTVPVAASMTTTVSRGQEGSGITSKLTSSSSMRCSRIQGTGCGFSWRNMRQCPARLLRRALAQLPPRVASNETFSHKDCIPTNGVRIECELPVFSPPATSLRKYRLRSLGRPSSGGGIDCASIGLPAPPHGTRRKRCSRPRTTAVPVPAQRPSLAGGQQLKR